MFLNDDYRDMLSALNDAGADFLVVGAYALAAHGNPRATGDIDILIRPSADNAERVWQALAAFGAPRRNLQVSDLTDLDTVFQLGVAPNRIDILTSISGVDFETAWQSRQPTEFADLVVNVLGRETLIANKKAAGRPKDLADVHWLETKHERKGG